MRESRPRRIYLVYENMRDTVLSAINTFTATDAQSLPSPWCAGADAKRGELVKPFRFWLVRQCVAIVRKLHQFGIGHRALREDNFVVDGNWKVLLRPDDLFASSGTRWSASCAHLLAESKTTAQNRQETEQADVDCLRALIAALMPEAGETLRAHADVSLNNIISLVQPECPVPVCSFSSISLLVFRHLPAPSVWISWAAGHSSLCAGFVSFYLCSVCVVRTRPDSHHQHPRLTATSQELFWPRLN